MATRKASEEDLVTLVEVLPMDELPEDVVTECKERKSAQVHHTEMLQERFNIPYDEYEESEELTDEEYLNRCYSEQVEEELIEIWQGHYPVDTKKTRAISFCGEEGGGTLDDVREFEIPDDLCCVDNCPNKPVVESVCKNHLNELEYIRRKRHEREEKQESNRSRRFSAMVGAMTVQLFEDETAQADKLAAAIHAWEEEEEGDGDDEESEVDEDAYLREDVDEEEEEEKSKQVAASSPKAVEDARDAARKMAQERASKSSTTPTPTVSNQIAGLSEAELVKIGEQIEGQMFGSGKKSEYHPAKRRSLLTLSTQPTNRRGSVQNRGARGSLVNMLGGDGGRSGSIVNLLGGATPAAFASTSLRDSLSSMHEAIHEHDDEESEDKKQTAEEKKKETEVEQQPAGGVSKSAKRRNRRKGKGAQNNNTATPQPTHSNSVHDDEWGDGHNLPQKGGGKKKKSNKKGGRR